ncbi:hypothetical protein [Bosea sp. LjRoot237]|uniref:hypothetical protein n=1 Tax=Bosea sp. LjRoot237 TaxID=3342292 RepID=UPI003ECC4352
MRARLQTALKPKPRSASGAPLKEWHLQSSAVKWLRRYRQAGWPIRIAGDMNAGRRTLREQGQASATGINAGEPDVRVYLPAGKLLLAEFKREGETTSEEQDDAHAELRALGHDVIVLTPANEDEAAAQLAEAVSQRLGMPIPHWEPPANDN